MKKVFFSLFLISVFSSIAFSQVSTSTFLTTDQILNRTLNKPTANALRVELKAGATIQTVLTPGSTVHVDNFPTTYALPSSQESLLSRPTVHVDAPVPVTQSGTWGVNVSSPVTINDNRYLNKVSSGSVAGLITGVTSASITVSDNVTTFGFLVKDSVKGHYITIQPTGYVSAIRLTDGDSDNEKVEIPQAMTFVLTNLQLTTTVQYNITAVK